MSRHNFAGHRAEQAAAAYLQSRGYTISHLNWRTPVCEIDIIASKDKRLYFVEVKYRKSSAWGSGLDYITRKKQQQMAFGAQCWIQKNRYDGDYSLSAIEVAGEEFLVTAFLPEI